MRSKAGAEVPARIADNRGDGVDVEIIFPNKGLAMWATPDPVFANAQCAVWNDWAWEQFGAYPESMLPVAAIATGDLPGSLAEMRRVWNNSVMNVLPSPRTTGRWRRCARPA